MHAPIYSIHSSPLQRSLSAALIILASVATPLHVRAADQNGSSLGQSQLADATRTDAGVQKKAELTVRAQQLKREASILAAADPELWLRVLKINEETLGPEHPETAASLNNLAQQYFNQGRYDEAEVLFKRALAIREKALGLEHPDTSVSLSNLAMLYRVQGRYGEAELLNKRSLAISEKALGAEHPDTAISLNNLADLYQAQGRYGEAEPLYKRALAISERVLGPEHPFTATTLNNLAGLYQAQARYGEVEALYQRSLAIREKTLGQEHPDTAVSLSNLAEFYFAEGRYVEAESLGKRALDIREKTLGPEHPDTGVSLNNQAEIYRAQGRYSEAELASKRSLAIKEKLLGLEHPSTITTLNNLAHLYQAQGRYSEAEAISRRSLAISEKLLGSEHPFTATILNNLGQLYGVQGRYVEAEAAFKRSLSIRAMAPGPDHPDTAISLNNLAEVYRNQGRWAEAEPLYKRSLLVLEKVLDPGHPDTATTRNNLGGLYLFQGRYEEAEPLVSHTVAIFEKTLGPEHPTTTTSLQNLALLFLYRADFQASQSLHERLNHVQANWLRRELPLQPRELRSSLLAAQPDASDTTFALLHQHPASAPLALELRLNRQGLLAEIEQRQRLLAASSPQTIALSQHIAGIDRLLSSTSVPSQRRSALQQERQSLEADLYRLLPALRIEPVAISQVAKALPPGSALLEIQRYRPLNPLRNARRKPADQWAEPHYVALLLFPDQRIRSIPLGPAAPLDAAIEQALKVSAEYKESPRPHWLKVANLLFRPLLPYLNGVRELFLSPDGSIHTVPFAALPSPSNNEQFLSESLRLRVLTTGRDLVRLQQPAAASTPAVVLANPDYGPPGVPWTQLTFTQREGDQIAAALGTTAITGSAASTAAVLKLRAPRILHIATHGFFQPPDRSAPSDPLSRSGLAFSGANRTPPSAADDAILTAAEATALQLNGTEIVVLSACETGLGDIQSGEGVYGLRRALTVAGARSTLLSLWKVKDNGTAIFMKTFYSHLLKGLSRADALAATQAQFRNRPEGLSDEHIWAAFQLTGDWRPLIKP